MVERVEVSIARLIDGMIRTMRQHPRCVGLAAPQVGRGLRLAVMEAARHPKVTSHHGLLVFINPQVDDAQGEQIGREGCLSVPDFTGNVKRATSVHVTALDRFGKVFGVYLDGFEAIVAQHEVDHLDGTLFLDRVANLAVDVFRRKTYL